MNVWLALATPEHVHAAIAQRWWEQENGTIAFCRLTQPGFLRLMTTAAAMDGRPLTIAETWRVYDRFFDYIDRLDLRTPDVEKRFREMAVGTIRFAQGLGRRLAVGVRTGGGRRAGRPLTRRSVRVALRVCCQRDCRAGCYYSTHEDCDSGGTGVVQP